MKVWFILHLRIWSNFFRRNIFGFWEQKSEKFNFSGTERTDDVFENLTGKLILALRCPQKRLVHTILFLHQIILLTSDIKRSNHIKFAEIFKQTILEDGKKKKKYPQRRIAFGQIFANFQQCRMRRMVGIWIRKNFGRN